MEYLKKTFRWFGPSFGVRLQDIKQLGIRGIVTACHQVPTGEVWSFNVVAALKKEIEAQDLKWSVVESVNVHDDIKYGRYKRDLYIQNYIETLKNLAGNGIYTVCYNFMPLIDWTRTDLNYKLPNGGISLCYDPIAAAAFDLFILKRKHETNLYDKEVRNRAALFFNKLNTEERRALKKAVLAGLPGSKEGIALTDFRKKLLRASQINKTELRSNLKYFLKAIIPEAEKLGIKMAIHPDDPPFPVFGIPRIVSTYDDLNFVLNCCPSQNNGLTFCSGSLGASPINDLVGMIQDFGSKIHFLHLRNVCKEPSGMFYEASHLKGSLPMEEVLLAIIKEQKRRLLDGNKDVAIPIRPDHGHVVLDDIDRQNEFYPGYSLIGRALGMAELNGLEKGLRKILD